MAPWLSLRFVHTVGDFDRLCYRKRRERTEKRDPGMCSSISSFKFIFSTHGFDWYLCVMVLIAVNKFAFFRDINI